MKTTPLEDLIVSTSGIGEKSREKLSEYQLCRIRETIEYARKSCEFYKKLLKDFKTDALQNLNCLDKIPYTFPQNLRDNPFAFLCVPQSQISRIVTLQSTGTSGNEKRIFFTEGDLERTVEFFSYGMRCLVSETDRVLVFLPGKSYGSIGDLLKKALNRKNIECFVYGVIDNTDKAANEIIEKDISCIVGIPSQVLRLSRVRGDAFYGRIKSVLLSADFVPEALISELTNRFRCKVFTHYGMTEMGYGGGVECEALDGYHMREADMYFEIVDPQSGLRVPDGEWGEVVFTTLNREAMPLIRYRTGDIAAFSKDQCICDTFLKTIRRVKGRLDNTIMLDGFTCVHLNELDETVFSYVQVLDYNASLLKDGSLNIDLLTADEKSFLEIKERIKTEIQKQVSLKNKINMPVNVTRKTEAEKYSGSMTKRIIRDLRERK